MQTPDAPLGAGTRAPTRAQRRSFALLSLLYAAITAAVIPWAGEPGPADPQIVVVYGIGILVADLCTAVLLGALYHANGRAAFLVLACAYLFGALMALAHMATFPGALFPQPLFGDDEAVAWLFLAWRVGAAGLMLAAVLCARADLPAHAQRRDARLAAGWLLTAAAVAGAAGVERDREPLARGDAQSRRWTR